MSRALEYLGALELHARDLALAAPAALAGLVAIWAATSRVHWLLRGLAIWTCVMALVPIAAYEPAVVLAISLPLIVALVRVSRWRVKQRVGIGVDATSGPRPRGFRFGLRDLFLLLFFIGLTLAGLMHVARHLGRLYVVDYVAASWAIFSVACCSHACVASRYRWSRVLLLLNLIGFAAFALSRVNVGVLTQVWYLLGHQGLRTGSLFQHESAIAALVLAEVALLVIVTMQLAVWSCDPVRSLPARCGLLLVSVLAAVPFSWLYCQMLWPTPAPPRPVKAGNRYDEVFKIASHVKLLKSAKPAALDSQQLTAFYDQAARLLDSPSYLPVSSAMRMSLADQGTLWDLYLGLDGEAFSAAAAGDDERAIRFALADLHFGAMHRRGGDTYSNQKGMINQWAAMRHLVRLRSRLSSEQAQTVMAALAQEANEWDPVAITLAIDDADFERRFGWAARLDQALNRLLGTSDYPWFEPHWRRHLALNLLLRTDFAIRLFEQDHQRLPKDLDELTPAYLSEVPRDPFDDQPLRYQTAAGQFLLYSIGHDGHDDGGRFAGILIYNTQSGYDLDLDTLERR